MMNKKQTSYRSMWKYTLILPIVAVLLFFNCTFQSKTNPDNDQPVTVTEVKVTQDDSASNDSTTVITIAESGKIQIFDHVEEMPRFPGGESELLKWLTDNMNYPKEAVEKGIQGRVILRFVISPDGPIENVEVLKGLDPSCDEEAVRTVKKMPNWIPGKQKGKPVYVYYSLPIVYRLTPS